MNRLPALGLAGLELRRFLRNRLTTAALVVLAVVPLLYGALYLYAFWDPYGRLNHIPAALVMTDRVATASDGSSVHAGQDIAEELIRRRVFDWHVTSARQAQRGLADGRYHIVLQIPADFSAALVTGPDPDSAPRVAQLQVVTDDATNYLSGQFSRSVFNEVRAAAAAKAATGYFDKMLIGFTDIKEQTAKAAAGAGRLHDGAVDAAAGASRLSTGLASADKGAGRLAGGLGTAARGADDLADGLVALRAGAGALAAGVQRAAAGGRQLATAADKKADTFGPLLRANAGRIGAAASLIAAAADTLADHIGDLRTGVDRVGRDGRTLRDGLDALARQHPELADDPGFTAVRRTAARLVQNATTLRQALTRAELDRLVHELRRTAAIAARVAAAAPHLADDIDAARAQVDRLATGLNRLAAGADRLHEGVGQAARGAIDLRGGLFRLASGARQLDGGLDALSAGGRRLATGLGDLEDGVEQLADGLAAGAQRIPGYGNDPAARADVLGDPVGLGRSVRHPAATYGVGFAPYFLALALWVGAMLTYMVLRPINRRHVMAGAPARRVVLACWLPAVAVGLAQAVVLFVVVTMGLGLNPVNPIATLAVLLLTTTVFTAIVQLFGVAFGTPGRLVVLVLLMLQLTSSGGTYPVQTSPAFFQAIHPWLPMTYVVAALRHTIDGGPAGPVVRAVAVLAVCAAVVFCLTALAARRARRMTPSALHPQLVV